MQAAVKAPTRCRRRLLRRDSKTSLAAGLQRDMYDRVLRNACTPTTTRRELPCPRTGVHRARKGAGASKHGDETRACVLRMRIGSVSKEMDERAPAVELRGGCEEGEGEGGRGMRRSGWAAGRARGYAGMTQAENAWSARFKVFLLVLAFVMQCSGPQDV
ncbi:hypothetical protein B0H19DRAFT_1074748 [Mycena capillaripes]|nr:hypothetical protein B0H19DRAFT_1074748 [Mycena capillaripes]